MSMLFSKNWPRRGSSNKPLIICETSECHQFRINVAYIRWYFSHSLNVTWRRANNKPLNGFLLFCLLLEGVSTGCNLDNLTKFGRDQLVMSITVVAVAVLFYCDAIYALNVALCDKKVIYIRSASMNDFNSWPSILILCALYLSVFSAPTLVLEIHSTNSVMIFFFCIRAHKTGLL